MKKIDEVILNGVPLTKIIEDHNLWCKSAGLEGSKANLRHLDFNDIDFNEAFLYKADISHCKFKDCDFSNSKSYTSLQHANIIHCEFENCNFANFSFYGAHIEYSKFYNCSFIKSSFSNTKFSHTIISGSDLSHAFFGDFSEAFFAAFKQDNFDGAIFDFASFYNTNFESSDFKNADVRKYNDFYNCCFEDIISNNLLDECIYMKLPSDGAFIGWKKIIVVNDGNDYYDPFIINTKCNKYDCYLVKLQIPASAKRSSSNGDKCRADKAKVLGIYDLGGKRLKLDHIVNYKVHCDRQIKTDYVVGKMVYPDSFDESRWNECSHGIHFFLTQQEAKDYY